MALSTAQTVFVRFLPFEPKATITKKKSHEHLIRLFDLKDVRKKFQKREEKQPFFFLNPLLQ